VILPKADALLLIPGSANWLWFNALKNSVRNSTLAFVNCSLKIRYAIFRPFEGGIALVGKTGVQESRTGSFDGAWPAPRSWSSHKLALPGLFYLPAF
jgi:hypothetical protein